MPEVTDMQRAQETARLLRSRTLAGSIRRGLHLLEAARKAILAEVADSDWDRWMLPKLLTNVHRAIDDWQDQARRSLGDEQRAGWQAGQHSMDAVHEALDVSVRLPMLPDSLVTALERRGAQAITHLASFARAAIDKEIATSLLSGGSREAAIDAIGRSLEAGATSGPAQGRFRAIRARARFIYQHEVGAAFSRARHLREEQTLQYVPELRRVWRHAGHPAVPRPDHIAMHGQERARGEAFVNPITGNVLDHPRDPAAPIEETANCTCDTVLWREAYGDKREFLAGGMGGRRRDRRIAIEALDGNAHPEEHITREDDDFNPLNLVVPGRPAVAGGRR